jgi:hypothetical protein
MNLIRLTTASLIVVSIVGCSQPARREPPAPVISAGGTSAQRPASTPSAAVTPLEPPRITTVPETTPARPMTVTPEPAPGVAPGVTTAGGAPVAGARGTEAVAMAAPSQPMSKAVKTLLQQAELQREGGDLTNAAATLERALRIEPKNAYVWNRLAHVRAQQGQSAMAAELAAKSNAFAGGDETLKRDNADLIARTSRSAPR